ncbi:MAG: PHP domain-containing protein [Planctomycetes bacterium]|nr:PHP domain-containing protein [Planctomycetota bacterium]
MASGALFVRLTVAAASLGALLLAARLSPDDGRTLDATMHHLGDDRTPDWKEAPEEPTAPPLEIPFESAANAGEWLLEVSARDVDNQWALALNGVEFARLRPTNDELRVGRYPVPPGLVKAGRNVLAVRAVDQPKDDITVGRIVLHERSLRELAQLGRVEVTVLDAETKQPIPARITVVDAAGAPLELFYAERPLAAVRPGIAYTGDGVATLEIPAGACTLWASRGMEWSAAKVEHVVVFGETSKVELSIRREVDTRGWVAADTHVHTLTYSGHGDASVEERLVTLAGEGIELAIATDHNHQTDYRPLQRALALNAWFTPVVGNEVTTDNGHMNAFPFDPSAPVPESKVTDWKALVAGIRAKGAKVVILNHPRWPEGGKDPLTNFGFDESTGLNAAGQEFTFDCIELVNSDCPTAPTNLVLPMWYALLERGLRFTAVGASDSHAVGVVVGQGRTYVPSATDDPTKLDVDAACEAFKRGEVSVSLGMFATIEVDGHRMGESFTPRGDEVEAVVTVRHPSWVTPRTLEIVVDRTSAATVRLDEPATGDTPTLQVRRVRLKLASDANWIVAVARGDKVSAPFWPMSVPETMAITNPVFVTR